MEKFLHQFLFAIAFLLPYLLPAQIRQEQAIFTTNNEAFFTIVGTRQHYEFSSDEMKTTVDRAENSFEFLLDMRTLQPENDPLHSEIITDIFYFQTVPRLRLTATMEEETANLANLTNSTTMVLQGLLTINDISFQVPVEVSFIAQDNQFFYNAEARFDLDLMDYPYDGEFADIITGEFVLFVNNAFWNTAVDDR